MGDFKDRFKSEIIFYLVIILDFYLLGHFVMDTGSGMFILLIVVPVICLITSIIYGLLIGFRLYFSLIVGILFIPTIFIYYNESAWVYAVAYAIISFIGQALGIIMSLTNKK
jgi:hypothetical protein